MSTQKFWNYRIGRNEERVSPEHHRVDVKCLGAVLTLAGLLFFVLATPVLADNGYNRGNAGGNQLIVRGAKAGIEQAAAQHGLMISGQLENADGYAAVVESAALTAAQVEDLLQGDSRVSDTSRVQLASLPASAGIAPASQDINTELAMSGGFTTPCMSEGFAGQVWSGYADQEAIREVHLHEAQAQSSDCGRSVVAVIDTGVGPNHPLLQGSLVAGYDFILETAGIPSEWNTFETSIAESLEEEMTAQGNQSRESVFGGNGDAWPDLSIAAIVEIGLQGNMEPSDQSYFGHGTMVAGLVRVAAPNAWIMPLRVFDGHGNAHIFDIIRAIYHAVDNGADVINMSFSVDETSLELRRAIQYARKNGVICVAAAGNQGLHTQNYPASYADVIAVASVDDGLLSPFSNYGSSLVDLAAPGTGVVSAYPGGQYGAGWGTSFSAPLVSGTIALLMSQYPDKSVASVQAIENDLKHGSDMLSGLNGLIGSGQLNALATVLEAQE